MLQHLKKYLPKIRFLVYGLLFFWLLTGCTSSIGVQTDVHKTQYKTSTTTGLTASMTLEDLKLTNKPTSTD